MKKKISFVSCVGDVADTHTLKYINTLIENGFEVETIRTGINPQTNFQHIRLPDISSNFWPSGNSILNILSAVIQRIRNSILLAKHLFNTKPNVVVATEPDSWVIAVFCRYLIKNEVIADIREVYEDRIDGIPKLLRSISLYFLKKVMLYCSRHTIEIIHVSKERQDVYSYLDKPGKVVVYYPELNLRPNPTGENETNEFIVIHAGALREKYGANEILGAFTILSKKYDQIKLYVLGGTAGFIKEQALLNTLVDKGVIRLYNQVPFNIVLEFLMKSKIGLNIVLPVDKSHYLAQPRKFYEYLSMGLPVVAANVPTIDRVVNKWKNGMTVNPYCSEDIAQAIEFYFLNEDARLTASENAISSHLSEYNWDLQRPNYLMIFKNLIS
jgi:glycosyltransferase involved in cell wall biosynthesis